MKIKDILMVNHKLKIRPTKGLSGKQYNFVAQPQGVSMKIIALVLISVLTFVLWAAIYLGIIAAVVWVIVKVLKATGVLH